MNFHPLDPIDDITPHHVGTGDGVLRAILLFGSAAAMMGLVLATLLTHHEARNINPTHPITATDLVLTAPTNLML